MGQLKIVTVATEANPNVGDFYLDENGKIPYISKDTSMKELVAQRIFARLQFFKGSWHWRLEAGAPYYQYVFGRSTDQDVYAVFLEILRNTPGVAAVRSLILTRNPLTRRLDVEFSVTAESGETVTQNDVGAYVVTIG